MSNTTIVNVTEHRSSDPEIVPLRGLDTGSIIRFYEDKDENPNNKSITNVTHDLLETRLSTEKLYLLIDWKNNPATPNSRGLWAIASLPRLSYVGLVDDESVMVEYHGQSKDLVDRFNSSDHKYQTVNINNTEEIIDVLFDSLNGSLNVSQVREKVQHAHPTLQQYAMDQLVKQFILALGDENTHVDDRNKRAVNTAKSIIKQRNWDDEK